MLNRLNKPNLEELDRMCAELASKLETYAVNECKRDVPQLYVICYLTNLMSKVRCIPRDISRRLGVSD